MPTSGSLDAHPLRFSRSFVADCQFISIPKSGSLIRGICKIKNTFPSTNQGNPFACSLQHLALQFFINAPFISRVGVISSKWIKGTLQSLIRIWQWAYLQVPDSPGNGLRKTYVPCGVQWLVQAFGSRFRPCPSPWWLTARTFENCIACIWRVGGWLSGWIPLDSCFRRNNKESLRFENPITYWIY